MSSHFPTDAGSIPQFFGLSGDELLIKPSTSSTFHDFDFLQGNWIVRNFKLTSRLTGSQEWTDFTADQEMRTVLCGQGNTDLMKGTVNNQPFEGMTLRLFNHSTRLWSIDWADSIRLTLDSPMTGSFDGPLGYFVGKDTLRGQDVLVAFKWDATNPAQPVWSQAFSNDEGRTWEWNWHMHFSRPGE